MAQTTFEIPKLTEANRLEEVSRFINGKTYHLIRLRPTVLNTLLRLLLTGMRAMGFAFMVMLVLYLPDYVFDYSVLLHLYRHYAGHRFCDFLGFHLSPSTDALY